MAEKQTYLDEEEATFDDLDLDAVDLAEGEEEVDLSGFGEIDDTVEYPHIKISTKSLKEFLKVSRQISGSMGRDVVSKSISFEVVGEQVYLRSTDFDVYLEKSVELLNQEAVLSGPLAIPQEILIKLIKAAPGNTVFYKDEEGYKMRLAGGDIPLETYNIDVEKFKFTDPVERKLSFTSTELYRIMKDFGPVVSAAVSPTERRIVCENGTSYANYMWAIISSGTAFGDMDLKMKDLNVLRPLLINVEEELTFLATKAEAKVDRRVIRGSTFQYAFLVSDTKVSTVLKESMADVLLEDGVFIDFMQYYKMIDVAAELPYSVGKVGLNFNEDGSLRLLIKTKKDKDALFTLTGSVSGAPKPLAEELILQARLLKIVLKAFAAHSSIKISLSDRGLGIRTDAYSAVIYNEA